MISAIQRRTFGNRHKKCRPKAVGHRERSASKRIFSSNTSLKSHGRRQPCRGFSSRLAEKISLFEVLCSFAAKIFSCNELRDRSNTWCIARARRKLQGKRWLQNRINPYGQPPGGRGFSYACTAVGGRSPRRGQERGAAPSAGDAHRAPIKRKLYGKRRSDGVSEHLRKRRCEGYAIRDDAMATIQLV